jgi:hypothetical protein
MYISVTQDCKIERVVPRVDGVAVDLYYFDDALNRQGLQVIYRDIGDDEVKRLQQWRDLDTGVTVAGRPGHVAIVDERDLFKRALS